MTEEPTTAPEPAEPATEPDEATEQEPDAEPDEQEHEAAEPDEPAEEKPATVTPEQLARAEKKIDGAVARYVAQVGEYAAATGQEFYRTGVDLPGLPGYIFDPREVPLSEDQMMGARILAGLDVERPLRDDPLSEQCRTCQGEGSVKTGSNVEGNRVVQCDTCHGHGFTGERLTRILRSGVPLTMETTGATGNQAQAPPPLDQFGTPLGHPGFGQNPAQWPAEWHDLLRGMGYGDRSHLNAVAG